MKAGGSYCTIAILSEPITVMLSFFVLQSVTDGFRTLNRTFNLVLAVVFVCGAYLYGAGEGWHEVASFTLNTYPAASNAPVARIDQPA